MYIQHFSWFKIKEFSYYRLLDYTNKIRNKIHWYEKRKQKKEKKTWIEETPKKWYERRLTENTWISKI